MIRSAYSLRYILMVGGMAFALSCNTDVTEIYEGTTLLYSTSFESAADTLGWSYTYPWATRYEEGAPSTGNYSLQVYGVDRTPRATYTFPSVDEGSTILVNFHARNIGNGVGLLRLRVMNHLPVAEQYIVDTTWNEFSLSGVFATGGVLKVELFGSVGGYNRTLFDGISVYLVKIP